MANKLNMTINPAYHQCTASENYCPVCDELSQRQSAFSDMTWWHYGLLILGMAVCILALVGKAIGIY